MWRLLLGTMGVKSLVQGLNAAATAGFEPRTVWSEVRRRNRLATARAVLIFVGEEMERVWLDRHTFLVACPPEHHLRKERSSAPSKLPKQMLFSRPIHGKKGTASVKYSVRAILRCDSSEWRATASGFSIARLSRRDWGALPVSGPVYTKTMWKR